jgi:small-conductance mechanosensitive channel
VSLDDVDFYRLVRARLEHEDGLTVNRLSWLVASQSFLFTAYAITLNGLAAGPGGPMAARQAMLCRLIPVIGVATTGLIYTGLVASARAMAWLRATFRARIADEARLGLPPVHAPGGILTLGQVAPRVLPLVFLVVWLALLLAAR